MSTVRLPDVAPSRLVAPAPRSDPALDEMVPRIARVIGRRRESAQVWTLDMEVEPDETPSAPFTPGQFNMLTVFGVGELAVSFSGDPAEQRRLLHTVRDVGPVSHMLRKLCPGDVVGLRGPYGHGWPMDEAIGRDVVLIGGGIGLAPLRPALYRLLAERERYGRIVLLYGTRSPEDILFRRELEGWRRRLDVDIAVTVDHAANGWYGNVGVVTALIARTAFDPLHAIAFVCGPEVMMRFAGGALNAAGLTDGQIYVSMERNMKCAIGLCGHCQFGPVFVCRDGPVFAYGRVRSFLAVKEI